MHNTNSNCPAQGVEFIDTIKAIVCEEEHVPMDLLESKTRKREIVQARQLAMKFAKNYTKASLATIGMNIGMKDHATVLHACKVINNLCDTDRSFRGRFIMLRERIESNIKKDDDEMLVCGICGSMDVQTKAWIDANTKKLIDEVEGDDEMDNWCPKCGEHTPLIRNIQYKARLQVIEDEKARINEQIREYNEQMETLEKEFEI